MHQTKTEEVYGDFSNDREKNFVFSNYPTKSKYYDDSSKLVVRKVKDDVAIEEFLVLKAKMHLHLVDNNSEHKKTKSINKNVAAEISHNEC